MPVDLKMKFDLTMPKSTKNQTRKDYSNDQMFKAESELEARFAQTFSG